MHDAVTGGIRVGLLETTGGTIGFRHAIIREAVLDATVPHVDRRAAPSRRRRARRRPRRRPLARDAGLVTSRRRARTTRPPALLAAAADSRIAGARPARRRAAGAAPRSISHRRPRPRGRGRRARELARRAGPVGRSARHRRDDRRGTKARRPSVASHGDVGARGRPARTRGCRSSRARSRPATTRRSLEIAAGRGCDSSAATAEAALGVRRTRLRGRDRRATTSVPGSAPSSSKAVRSTSSATATTADAAWTQQADEAAAAGHTQAQLRAVVQLGKVELFAGRPPARLYEAVELARAAGAFVELGVGGGESRGRCSASTATSLRSMRILDEAIPRCRDLRLDQLAYLLAARGDHREFSQRRVRRVARSRPRRSRRPTTCSFTPRHARRHLRCARAATTDAIALVRRVATRSMRRMPGVVPSDSQCWLVWALAGDGRIDDAEAALDAVRAMPDLERWYGRPLVVAAADALLEGDDARLDKRASATCPMPMDVALMRLLGSRDPRGPGARAMAAGSARHLRACGRDGHRRPRAPAAARSRRTRATPATPVGTRARRPCGQGRDRARSRSAAAASARACRTPRSPSACSCRCAPSRPTCRRCSRSSTPAAAGSSRR